MDVGDAVAGHRERQVRAVAGDGLQIGALRQRVNMGDVVLGRAQRGGDVADAAFGHEDAFAVVGIPTAGVLDHIRAAVGDVERHCAEVVRGHARRDRDIDRIRSRVGLGKRRALLGGDAGGEILRGHKLVAGLGSVSDEICVHLRRINARVRGVGGCVPVGHTIVMPRPHDDRRLRVGRELVEEGLPVGQRLRGRLVVILNLGEVESDIRRDIDRTRIAGVDVAESIGGARADAGPAAVDIAVSPFALG